MAVITSYATLLTAVDDYLSRTDLGASGGGFSANFVQNMEGKLYRALRFIGNEATLSGTISSGLLTVPSDYVALKVVNVIVGSEYFSLDRVSPEEVYARFPVRSEQLIPKLIARESTSFIFGPSAGGYSISGVYYKRLTALRTSLTNWFTDNAPDILLYGSLMEAAVFTRNDADVQKYQGMFTEAINTLNTMERIERNSGSSLTSRPG